MVKTDSSNLPQVTFRRREFDTCVDLCTGILDRNPYDEAVWSLKTRALTAQVWTQSPVFNRRP
jgi:tetratricopeptide repeat protein 8